MAGNKRAQRVARAKRRVDVLHARGVEMNLKKGSDYAVESALRKAPLLKYKQAEIGTRVTNVRANPYLFKAGAELSRRRRKAT